MLVRLELGYHGCRGEATPTRLEGARGWGRRVEGGGQGPKGGELSERATVWRIESKTDNT
jgi:hypothetical protein